MHTYTQTKYWQTKYSYAHVLMIKCNDKKLKSGLSAYYAIQPGNNSGLFYSSWDQHWAKHMGSHVINETVT